MGEQSPQIKRGNKKTALGAASELREVISKDGRSKLRRQAKAQRALKHKVLISCGFVP